MLTKRDILAAIENGDVCIGFPDKDHPDGWDWSANPENLAIGPNSIDLHLHPEMLVYKDVVRNAFLGELYPPDVVVPLDIAGSNRTEVLTIPAGDEGLVLYPGILYLARTLERTRTTAHVPEVGGRSSTARLGIAIHLTAGKGDVGFDGTWTMEITVQHPVRVYRHQRIAQIWLHEVSTRLAEVDQYGGSHGGRYQGQIEATPYRGMRGAVSKFKGGDG